MMNNHFKPFGAFLLLVVALLTGCGNKPPGCADPLTLTTAKQLVEENANKAFFSRDVFSDDPDGWMKKFYDEMKVEITGVVSEGYKEDAKKQLCRGTLKITMVSGQTLERAVEYSTQKTEDKKDSFLLEFQDFAPFAAVTAEAARKYYDGKRWAGTWNGTYACSGVNGATDGPQGPYALPVSMSVEGVNAKLERTTRGGGDEILEGQFGSFYATDQYKLRGEGQNSPDDKWTTSFMGKVTGKRFVADGAITVRGDTLRQCKLDLTLGGPAAPQFAAPKSATTVNQPERAASPEELAFFESKIRPVLVGKCYQCHATGEGNKVKGGLALDTREATRKGGDTGPAVVPGDTNKSLLLEAIRYANKDNQMPPKTKLPDSIIKDFEQWVRMGAPDPRGSGAVADAGAAEAQWKKKEINIDDRDCGDTQVYAFARFFVCPYRDRRDRSGLVLFRRVK